MQRRTATAEAQSSRLSLSWIIPPGRSYLREAIYGREGDLLVPNMILLQPLDQELIAFVKAKYLKALSEQFQQALKDDVELGEEFDNLQLGTSPVTDPIHESAQVIAYRQNFLICQASSCGHGRISLRQLSFVPGDLSLGKKMGYKSSGRCYRLTN